MLFRKFLRGLRNGWFLTLVIVVVLGACVWYFGPLILWGEDRPLDPVRARIITIAVIAVLAFMIPTLLWVLRRRRDRKMTEEIVESVDTGDEVLTGEMDEMRAKMRSAMAQLRKSRRGRASIYELPWYLMIGPPGAGKTTAIVNSGLSFPLADTAGGAAAIGGVGGTRNCDWWFTDDAVLIDTAGRYTTQESDAEADNAAWQGFLDLLKRYRKRQPVNGALIAISLSDLSMTDELTQAAHARAIRRRLHELREKLGVRFPVYVLFTKADLIAGFQEFFEPLGREAREQIWGFTLPLEAKTRKAAARTESRTEARTEESPAIAGFDTEFALLLERLNAQSLERMQSETDPQRRSLVAGFPPQLATLRQVARDFLAEVFQDNRYEHRQMLRGVYFTSGTQEGTPIDRLMMGMARTFGIGRQAIGSGRGTGRSFFLTRLFLNVVFREAGLVSADDKVERRYRWARRGAIAAVVLVAAAAAGLWTRSYLGNRALLAASNAAIEDYRAAAALIPGSPIGDTDLPGVVPALNILRDMPAGLASGRADPAGDLGWGLYQGPVLASTARQSYRAALNEHLLPRLILRLEEQMLANINNPDLLYEALKIYLMLGAQGPMNTRLVKDWMRIDWSIAFPGPDRETLREDLARHLDTLLSEPRVEIALNGPLIERVRIILLEMPMAERVYNGILNSPAAQALPQLRLTDVGGPAVARVMTRSSGKPLGEGVEGIFTWNGFHDVFLGEALGVARRIQGESWVLGPQGEAEQSDAALLALSRDVLDLYYSDYVERYDTLMGDIDIIPLQSLSHAVEVVNVLSGPTSPLVNILTAISKETSLTKSRAVLDTSAAKAGLSTVAEREVLSNLDATSQSLFSALSSAAENRLAGAAPPPPPGAYVENRFDWLHQLVERPEGQPSQLDGLIGTLGEVYRELNRLSFSGAQTLGGGGFAAAPEATALSRLQQGVANMPGPLPRWVTQVAQGASGITADGTRASLNATWQSEVLPFCTQALGNRYPMTRRAQADTSMQDFGRLFAPDGLIDGFFKQNLAKFVDTRTNPWSFRPGAGTDLGIAPGVLQQFQNAAAIRDAFFATGGAVPSVAFQITPEALDPKAKSVQLKIDGTAVDFSHKDGVPGPTAITWPGQVGMAQIAFVPPPAGSQGGMRFDGPWGWFRLLDAAEVRRTNVSDRNRIIFNIGGQIAIFQMQSGSVLNPFALPALGQFSCPESF
jgi:type VI secretion system protein ImpL